ILVAQGSDRVDQLLVSKFDGEQKAEDEAVFTVTGLADTGVECKRTRLHQTLVYDCPGTYQSKSYRRLFFPIPHNGESYLLLIQTPGETLAEAGRVAEPIVNSVKFR
ncbi:MAG: hypothetical protein QOJ72_1143, partial [Nocardioidaceae bacterium]|nr:hypothetical protein [Nocardioidaceae bacterium]